MSNIAKTRILIPKGVTLHIRGWKLKAEGKYGEFTLLFPHYTFLTIENNYLNLKAKYISSALSGTYHRKIKSLLYGLSYEYRGFLNFVGVGYRAAIESNKLVMRLGYSHNIKVELPKTSTLNVIKRSIVKIKGSNYEELNSYAHKLRAYRKPEPFKGKGIIFNNESLRRKEGKKKKT